MPALPWQHFSGSHFIGYCAVPIGILYSPSTSPTQPLVKLEFSSSSLRFWVQLNFFESYVTSKSLKFFIAWFWKWQIFIAKRSLCISVSRLRGWSSLLKGLLSFLSLIISMMILLKKVIQMTTGGKLYLKLSSAAWDPKAAAGEYTYKARFQHL